MGKKKIKIPEFVVCSCCGKTIEKDNNKKLKINNKICYLCENDYDIKLKETEDKDKIKELCSSIVNYELDNRIMATYYTMWKSYDLDLHSICSYLNFNVTKLKESFILKKFSHYKQAMNYLAKIVIGNADKIPVKDETVLSDYVEYECHFSRPKRKKRTVEEIERDLQEMEWDDSDD